VNVLTPSAIAIEVFLTWLKWSFELFLTRFLPSILTGIAKDGELSYPEGHGEKLTGSRGLKRTTNIIGPCSLCYLCVRQPSWYSQSLIVQTIWHWTTWVSTCVNECVNSYQQRWCLSCLCLVQYNRWDLSFLYILLCNKNFNESVLLRRIAIL
jgi:hypothetical protein